MFEIVLRKPFLEDGKKIYNLVKDTKVLDLNSEYLYLLQATHFSQFCCVAQAGGDIIGFVSGYIKPNEENRFFIWQVGVDEKYRGNNLAARMIEDILQRDWCKGIDILETTISPSNSSSQRVFEKFAQKHGFEITKEEFFKIEHFNNAHEDELLYTIKIK
jgi:L-2,4-diaminobutyric acid acetyltransferase